MEIMIVVAIIGLLLAVAIPNFGNARGTAQRTGCINNLQQIDGAKTTWAMENKKQDTDAVTLEDLKKYIKLDANGNIPGCPAGGTYSITTVGDNPICSLASKGHKLP